MRDKKAQVAVEFMICILFLVAVMIVFTIYSWSKDSERRHVQSKLEAEKICWQLSNLINTAMYSKGYYAEFSLPMKIDGSSYNVSITNNTVVADYRGHSCIYQVTVTDISFKNSSMSKTAPFCLCGGDFYINNTNDELFISNRGTIGCNVGC